DRADRNRSARQRPTHRWNGLCRKGGFVTPGPGLPDVYSAGEIARAAGVRPRDVRALAEAEVIRPLPGGLFFSSADAIAAGPALTGGAGAAERPLFPPASAVRRKPGLPMALAGPPPP